MNYLLMDWAAARRALSCFVSLMALFLTGCLPKEPMVEITAAENIRQVSDGRVFVTGRESLFQILQASDGSFYTEDVIAGIDQPCVYYSGLAELNDWLFFVCVTAADISFKDLKFNRAGILMAYSLKDERVVSVMDLANYQFPNGLDALPTEDAILIADEDFFLAIGGVSKASFDFSTGEPLLTNYHYRWIGPDQQVFAANGVRVVEGAVYLTDIGFFKRVEILADGTPSSAEILYKNLTVLDDFDAFCDGFLITDYVKGRLVYVPSNGDKAQPTANGLNSPSALLGRPAGAFNDGSVWVTESGGLQPGGGNQLVRIPVSELRVTACAG